MFDLATIEQCTDPRVDIVIVSTVHVCRGGGEPAGYEYLINCCYPLQPTD